MQIDLEPTAYRETGKARIIRSILHKPVFMTISTVLALWVACSLGVPQIAEGNFEIPLPWAVFLLLSWVVAPAFFIWAIFNDGDRVEPAPPGSQVSEGRQQRVQAPGQRPAADQARRVPSSRQDGRQ